MSKGSAKQVDRDPSDVSRLEHLNSVLRAVRNVNQLITRETSRKELLQGICACLTATRGYYNAWTTLLDPSGTRSTLTASSGFDGAFAPLCEQLAAGVFPSCVRRALASNQTLIIDNPQEDCSECPLAMGYGGRAGMVRRLTDEGHTYGILAVSVPLHFALDEEEQELFEEVAGDVAYALRRIQEAETLRDTQRRYREVFEGSRDGYVMVATDGRIIDANRAYCQMLGYRLDELRAMKNFYEITPERWRQWERDEIWNKRLLREGYSGIYEKEYVRKDGTVFPVELQSYAVLGAHGQPEYLWGVVRDITEEKRTEERLRRNQLMLERTERIASVGSWHWEVAGDYVTWSEELFRIFGLDPKDGAPPFVEHDKLYLPEDFKRLRAAVDEALAHGKPYDLELNVRRSDGEIRHGRCLGFPEIGPDGKVTRLYGALQDITEQRRAERAYSRFCEMAAQMICVADINTATFIQVNPAFERILGYSEAELLDRPFLEFIHPDDVQAAVDLLEKKLKAGESVISFTNRYRCKDGSYRVLEWNSYPQPEEGITYAIAQDVTDRADAEQTLRCSEHRFRSFVENANDIVYGLTPDGVFTYISPNWLEFMGERAEDAIGRSFEPYVVPEDRHLCREFLQRVLDVGGQHDSVEYRVVRTDGEIRWHLSRGSPLRDEDGNIISYVGIARDVTERREAEERLRTSEARYRSLTENFPNGALFLYDENFRYLAANGKGFARAGLSSADVVGRTVAEVFPEHWDFMRPHHEATVRGEESYYELDYRGRLYSNQCVPITDERGQPTGHGIVIAQDITERRKAEQERTRYHELLRAVIRQAPFAVHIVEGKPDDLQVVVENAEACRLLGESLAERTNIDGGDAEALTCRFFSADGEHEVPLSEMPGVRALRGDTATNETYMFRHSDGAEHHIIANATPITLPGEGRNVAVVTFHDVSDWVKTEREKQKLEAQLHQAQKMEAIGRLAGGVAHDFNNVLTAILGNVELAQVSLSSGDFDPQELQQELQHVERAAQRAASLTRQLLAFSRRQITQPQTLDLNEAVGAMRPMLRRLLAEDIALAFVPEQDVPPVRMDPGQIEQIIMNLVVNAGDAMPQGGKLTIETTAATLDAAYLRTHAGANAGPYAMIGVSDTGCGMDAATQQRIWEPFFTTKGVGQGTGLGLATVYGIVKQAGGYVMVYSEPGHGSTFKIYLPACPGEQPEPLPANREAQQLVAGNEMILVCEDDDAVRQLTTQMLTSAGYEVLAARSGTEALRLIAETERPVTMLITDVVMPDMNGRELVDRLAELATPPRTLFVSGYTSNVIAHHGVLDQGVEFLEKPFSRDTLLRRVRSILDA